jgi:hypothetical protein
MNEEKLSSLSYRELQTLAKENDLKANSSKVNLINLLTPILCVSNNDVEVEINTNEEKEEEITIVAEEQKVIEVEQEEIITENIQDILNVGDSAECLDYDEWTNCIIERINKVTMRVKITLTGKSKSLKFNQIRQSKSIQHMDTIKEDEFEEEVEVLEIELQSPIEIVTKNVEVDEEKVQEEKDEEIVEDNNEEEEEEEEIVDVTNNEQEEFEMTINQENLPTDEETVVEMKDEEIELLVNDVTIEWATSMEGCMAELSTKMIAKTAVIAPKPWNSCVKSPFKPKIEIEQIPEFKKKFSNTPIKKESRLSLMPKSTKAHLARHEAIKEKIQKNALEKVSFIFFNYIFKNYLLFNIII